MRKEILQTYIKHKHSFVHGSSVKTKCWYIWRTTGLKPGKGALSRELDSMVADGVFVCGLNPIGYKTYTKP